MATPTVGTFEVWLTETLKSASSDIDSDVFVSYIIGILDTDSSEEEPEESITELLSGVIDVEAARQVSKSIITQWKAEVSSRNQLHDTEDVDDKLAKMFQKQNLATVKEKVVSKEEADRKAAILAQYGQVSDGEESQSEGSDGESATPSSGVPPSSGGQATCGRGKVDSRESGDPLLVRNVNKEEVTRLEREKRDKAKEETEKKKEKDKQDRLAQKQKQQDRKETEKKRTQKGEKRR